MFRHVVSLAACLLFLLVWSSGCGVADKPLASVNGETIFCGDLNAFVNLVRLINPGLEAMWEEDSSRERLQADLLEMLIMFKLVEQEAQISGLAVDGKLLLEKTEELICRTADNHYGGSPALLEERRRQLGLPAAALSIIPRFELLLQALGDRIDAELSDEEVLLFLEKNPELSVQPAAVRVYQFCFSDEESAREAWQQLQAGKPAGDLLQELPVDRRFLRGTCLGWVLENDPFFNQSAGSALFAVRAANTGHLVKTGTGYDLYWADAYKPAASRDLPAAIQEAARYKQNLLYQEHLHDLWSKAQITLMP